MNLQTPAIVELLKQLEADTSLTYTQYLTDGDEDLFHPSVKAVLEAMSDHCSPELQQELKEAGFRIIIGDCICIGTSKGVINTGHDHF